ncbi:MAG TPA: tripartite tricarboxylate transporter substrate binding protein [Xanthobacteraceae bacterium]|nr:tripartite tricarboxylate transporter substrate binding protein [Xanthobacteraceae bacterium]
MKLRRRQFLHLTACAAALPAAAHAQAYPSRPVRVIVGAVPGSAPDVIARLAANWLSRRLGQTFFVDNRNGASGNLAAEAVAGAPPDGYTLLLVSASDAINATLYHHLKFNLLGNFVAIGGLVGFPMVITVSAPFQAKTLAELIAYAKANPGKLNIGTPPVGSPQHVAGELFNMMSGTDIVFVAYRGGPQAITDALGGQVQGVVGTVLLTIEQIRSGGLRPLAVTSARRSDLLPDTPTVGSVVPGFEASQWIGLVAPKNTPPEIIDRINREIQLGLADPATKARIANLGGTPLPGSPAAFGKFTADEVEKWGKVIKFANITAE